MQPYRARLRDLVDRRGALCVGLDPHGALLDQWGLSRDADGAERLARDMVAALGDSVAAFKPQAAFFESYGSRGVAALERVLADIRATGALAILDAKRGDIGSTMAGYANSALVPDAPLECDALTVSPYLGLGALQPAIDAAIEHGKGLYVLCRTSNPQGAGVQLARNAAGMSVAQQIADEAQAINRASGSDAIGLVIGATRQLDVDLDGFTGSLLVPGVGAQGGTMGELPELFASAVAQVLPASSRDIMSAGPDPEALRAKVAHTVRECPALAPHDSPTHGQDTEAKEHQ